MSDTPSPAFDPDTTPNALVGETGQDWQPAGVPVATYPHGETFTDAETGEVRHVPVPVGDDGTPTGTSVGTTANHPKPWLDVQGHGAASDEAHARHDEQEES